MNPLNYEFFGLPTLRGKLFNDVKKIVPTEVCLESEGWREDTYFMFSWGEFIYACGFKSNNFKFYKSKVNIYIFNIFM